MKKLNKKRPNIIYSNFKKAIKDLRKIKTHFWISFLLFFLITFIGFLIPNLFEENIKEIIRNLLTKTQDLNTLELIRFITVNNMTSAFFGMALGIVLGVLPLSVIILNGYILGYAINKTVAIEGFLIIWKLLPHGIFEIPAILISVALGLRLGIELMHNCINHYTKTSEIKTLFLIILSIIFLPISFIIYLVFTFKNKKLRTSLYKNIAESLRIFILIVVPLLVIAGIIEGLLIGLVG
ncbi:hypothetical protein CMI42_05130 [Candidatus Pacearchaeota archaeon]|nr:hypothetical protein [Candidatus Pacearchaeota archaeon]